MPYSIHVNLQIKKKKEKKKKRCGLQTGVQWVVWNTVSHCTVGFRITQLRSQKLISFSHLMTDNSTAFMNVKLKLKDWTKTPERTQIVLSCSKEWIFPTLQLHEGIEKKVNLKVCESATWPWYGLILPRSAEAVVW